MITNLDSVNDEKLQFLNVRQSIKSLLDNELVKIEPSFEEMLQNVHDIIYSFQSDISHKNNNGT